MKFDIDMRVLKAAAICVSTDSVRYYLNGVAIQWNGKYLTATATDGHRLVSFNLPYNEADFAGVDKFSFIIPHTVLKGVKLDKYVTVGSLAFEPSESGAATCTLSCVGTSTIFQTIDGTFPDWRPILPTELSGEVAQFNTGYLKDFAAMTKILFGKERLINVHHNGNGPAAVDLRADGEFDTVAVVMPVRAAGDWSYVKPEWAK
jgi:DNA polymerase-3 subunit beta